LFVLLSAVLVLYVYQRRKPTTLLPFFMIPVVMIGFPAFQKISFANDVVSVEKNVEKLAENPGDANARRQLAETVKQVEQRPVKDPKTNLTLARAYKALGQIDHADAKVKSVLRDYPHLPEATRLRDELRR
jgi:hypothetical protein